MEIADSIQQVNRMKEHQEHWLHWTKNHWRPAIELFQWWVPKGQHIFKGFMNIQSKYTTSDCLSWVCLKSLNQIHTVKLSPVIMWSVLAIGSDLTAVSKVCAELQAREQLLLEAMVVVKWCDQCVMLELNLMEDQNVLTRVSNGMTVLGGGTVLLHMQYTEKAVG